MFGNVRGTVRLPRPHHVMASRDDVVALGTCKKIDKESGIDPMSTSRGNGNGSDVGGMADGAL